MKQYKENINWVSMNPQLYTPVSQGIVLLKQAENNTEAKAFMISVLSDNAKDIFKKFGYLIK